MADKYGVEQLSELEGIKAIRLRPGMYIGSVSEDGLHHVTLEIISNSIDEYLNGHGTKIAIKVGKDGFITVADNARGIPVGKMKNGTNSLETVLTKLHSGAKFTSDGSTGYNSSGGMNGVGAKAANALSSTFIAVVKRDGNIYRMDFSKGKRIGEMTTKKNEKADETGTIISFLPDTEIFKEGIDLNMKRLNTQIQELSYLCKNLEFAVVDEKNNELKTYCSKKGLLDYVIDLAKGNQVLTTPFYCDAKEGQLGVEIAMVYVNTYSESIRLYTNNIPNSSGTHLTGFKAAMTRAINEYARDKKLLKEKDENLTGEDLKEGMVLTLSFKMPDPVFSGQTKDSLESTEGRRIVERLVSKEIRTWFEAHPNDAKAIITKAQLSKKAREAAKKARETTRKKAGSVLSSVLPGKLADCSSKDASECEIYLVEGDSAGGSAKQARDRKTQAILPLRGKVLNTQRKTLTQVLDNKEIKAMVTAFGVGVGPTVDIDKRRYDRIIIMTDGDVDGSHIRTLLLTFIFKYMRELIEGGHVYAAMPPLYKVVKNKESIYIQDDAKLADYKKSHANENLEVQRFKGLGEMNPDELCETTMDRTKRRLKQITIEDGAKAQAVFEKLMGESVSPRKAFIEQNAERANIDV